MLGCTWLYLALPWSALIYLSTDCHVLPLTGLNAFVFTGLNAQKVDGWMGGRTEISGRPYSKSTYGANKDNVSNVSYWCGELTDVILV